MSDEEQSEEDSVDFFNGASARIAGTWIQDANGWWYRHEDGGYTKNNWENINGTWFYFDANGYMYTGWLQYAGRWHYFNSTGVKQNSSFKRDVAKDKIIFVVPDGGYSYANVEMHYTEEYIKVGSNSHYISHEHVFLMQALGATEVPGFDYMPIRYSDGKTATPMSRFDIIVESGWDVVCRYGNYNKLSYANNTSVYGEATAVIYCNGAAVPVVGLTAKIDLKN